MSWFENLQKLYNHEKTGACPCCGSKNTDGAFTVIVKDKMMGSGTVWCNDCKKAYYASRLRVPYIEEKKIPQTLSFV